MRILGTHHCGKEHQDTFNRWGNLHDVLFRNDYSERVVSSFSHKIQSEYNGGNRSIFIKGIAVEHFSASHHYSPLLASYHVSSHEMLIFLYDGSKQDAAPTYEHSKHIIELLQNRKVLFSEIIIIWENTDGCAEQYLCATVIYLLWILAHT